MILVDANLLVYAHVASSPRHRDARRWLDGQLNGPSKVGLPWPSLLAFLRLVTNARIYAKPESMAAAWAQVEAWTSVENVWIPEPTERHRELLARFLSPGSKSNLVPDAHLAAIALGHGLTLCSTDGDFARFPGLRWEDPLAER